MGVNLNILGITLARGGSKGVPQKNIRQLDGKPLIAYTIAPALESQYLTGYIVSTDCEDIAQVSREYGAEVPFLRPKEFSTDSASSVSALQHAVNWMEKEKGIQYDYIVEIMATNPFKTVEDIDGCIDLLVQKQADSVIAVHRLEDHHPARIKKIVDGKIRSFCVEEVPESRRQDLKPFAYIRSGSIYALSRDHLMVDNRRYGSEESYAWVLDEDNVVNIDTEMDFHIAEAMLAFKKDR